MIVGGCDIMSITSSSLTIAGIPSEIIEYALTFLHPSDVAKFSQTCHLAHTLVYGSSDSYLWRQLFLLHPFDDPRKALGSHACISYNWKGELQRRIKAELIAMGIKQRRKECVFALETFIAMVLDASPIQAGLEHMQSGSLDWVTRVLRESNILDVTSLSLEMKDIQLVSRLRTYLALSLERVQDDKDRARLSALRANSRCYVYDLRNYRRDNEYGPYLRGGQVNWVHAEAIVNVIQMNLAELHSVWLDTRPPVGLEATRMYSAPDATAHSAEDWACVEGSWRRHVCFMDYRDLFAFNYATDSRGSRDPSFFNRFNDGNFQEATRLIELKLHLVPASSLPQNFVFVKPRKSSKSAKYPNLYFSGTSKGIVQGNESTVHGSVHMGDDGVLRWRFASVYDGHTQWSSEGIQLGGIGSAAGVVGSWTAAMHDHGDPVGPFWLWRVPDHQNYTSHLKLEP